MMYYYYKIGIRGFCCEMNTLMLWIEDEVIKKKKNAKVFVDSSSSPYFKKFNIFEVFEMNQYFIKTTPPWVNCFVSADKIRSSKMGAKSGIAPEVWREIFTPTKKFRWKIRQLTRNLKLNDQIACFHIRMGDKIGAKPYRRKIEDRKYDFEEYFEKIKNLNIHTIFVMSDDYRVLKDANDYFFQKKLNYNVASVISKKLLGHSTIENVKNKKIYNINELGRFLAEIEMAKKSKIFVGSLKSNVYRFIRNQSGQPKKLIDVSRRN